ncbi:PREDICTED: tether containing UBX domain for GLUT4 isoform X1 [Gekko japonicus]|uniref:Tether containing UBX domain for GLUT4 isoform X1 n=1 Tax=Gekko japonicus TaxID=146911 RepID=A0ABM1KQ58_GEKJA|nr:PREDICTED: tether containing UBX domain for GLUT4 isoform X1 [Gekko japonicus]
MSAAGGAGASTVSVLTPNGRRVTVRVGPSTALLQVLEEACRKQDFSPNEYDLKFQRTVLDLSLQWRFANLPNNARLEMVPISHNRSGTETMVRIALQLDDGSRLQDTFCSSQTLREILDHFAQTRQYVEQYCENSPVCIYMRDEVTGQTALEKTTLKSLGLTGGSAIIRVISKKSTLCGHAEARNHGSPTKELIPRAASREEPEGSEQHLGRSIPEPVTPPVSDVPLSNLTTFLSSPGGPSKPKKSKNSQEKLKVQKKSLEREAVVCHPDLQKPLDSGLQELPDEFFEVTVDDVRKRLAQLRSERKHLEEAPLMTQAQRDAQVKEKLERYPKVVLRVYFPDRHILQGFFHPNETIGALRCFVRSHLADPEMSFYLFIAPPRSILSDDSLTLFQANLFPAAVVHFGSEKCSDHYLRLDLMESVVSPSEADLLVARYLSRSVAHTSLSSSESVSGPPPEPDEADECVVTEHTTAAALEVTQPPARRTASGKVPKWLKLPGGKK